MPGTALGASGPATAAAATTAVVVEVVVVVVVVVVVLDLNVDLVDERGACVGRIGIVRVDPR